MQENLNESKSIYLQIGEMIENEILRDILKEEERVPSTNEFAQFYRINPATAGKGINLLVDEGILYKQRGIGMFVSKGAKEMIRNKRKETFVDQYVKTMLEEAKRLNISKEELIAMISNTEEDK
ncbi:MAG: GntR family transcriptional regulator [Lachnospiraceae bacterium]|nr:GntR family transcriptional regulator [Lachnospiraceae bacterium]